jgi:putative hydrolase of the HAD superfamily
VIFDLWDTLVPYDEEIARRGYELLAARAGVEVERFIPVWREGRVARDSGPLLDNVRSVLREVGADEAIAETLCAVRRNHTKAMLVPRADALETLVELKRRGLKRGLISVCSQDVADVWPEFELSRTIDDAVFSCAVGLRKPDPEIYLLACRRLGVGPRDCLYVGDGGSDELAGATRVGMKPVCVVPPGRDEPQWPEVRGWDPTVQSLREIVELL